MNNGKITTYPEPPSGLLARILARISAERQLRAMRRSFTMALAILAGTTASLVPIWLWFWAGVTRSGFDQFVRLAVMDYRIFLANWQDFGLSLLESLPIFSTVALLATVLVMLLAVKYAVKNNKAVFPHPLFHSNKS
jgi:hypothetical protein